MNEKRTLEILGRFRDLISSPMMKATRSTRGTKKSLESLGRLKGRPLNKVRKDADLAAKSMKGLRVAAAAFVGFLAARAGAQQFTGLIETQKFTERVAVLLDESVENVSRLQFAFRNVGVEAEEVEGILESIVSESADALRGGERLRGFQDLGIGIQQLRDLRPIDLLGEVARGLEGYADGLDRAQALEAVFTSDFRFLLPLLGQGEERYRALIASADRYGAVIGDENVRAASAFRTSLIQLQSSIEGVGREFITAIAGNAVPILESLARIITQNRDRFIEFAKIVGRLSLEVFDTLITAFINFADAIDSLPGVDLIDRSAITKDLAAIRSEILSIDAERDRLRDERRPALSQQRDLLNEQVRAARDRGLSGQELQDAVRPFRVSSIGSADSQVPPEVQAVFQRTQSQMEDLDDRLAALRFDETNLELALERGIGQVLRRFRDQFETVFEEQSRRLLEASEVTTGGAPVEVSEARRPTPAPVLPGPGFQGPILDPGSGAAADERFLERRAIDQQRSVLELERQVASLRIPSVQVQQEIAKIGAEIDKLNVRQLELDEVIGSADARAALAGIEDGLARTNLGFQLAADQGALQLQQQLLALEPPGRDVQRMLLELDVQAQQMEFGAAFLEGRITAEEFALALERIQKQAERLRREVDGDFFEGFSQGAQQAFEAWTDMTEFGRQAASSLVNQGLDGVTNALTDVVTGTKTAKEAFRDFATDTLRLIAQIAIKAAVLSALGVPFSPAGSFADGGVMPGRMGSRVPFRAYASGGIARSPQLALFGEGPTAEAFVPLPDGRSIPVSLQGPGGGSTVFQFSIQALDAQSVRHMLVREAQTIMNVYRHSLESTNSARQATKRAVA